MRDLHVIEKVGSNDYKKYPITEDDYVKIMEDIGEILGFKTLKKVILNIN